MQTVSPEQPSQPVKAELVGAGSSEHVDPATVSAAVRTRRRRWPRRLVIGLVGAFAAAGVLATYQFLFGPPQTGHFRSPVGRAEYVAAYEGAMSAMPAPTAVHDVATSLGTVRAYEWTPAGTKPSTPVVLVPGRSSGVPMWSENLPGFMHGRRILAVDPLGDAGLSVQGVPMSSAGDQASWMHEVIKALAPGGAHVVGHSFGAATAATYALHYPNDVVSLTLLEPVFTFAYPPAGMMAWLVVASLPGLPDPLREAALGRIGGGDFDDTEPLARMIAAATEHYAAALPNPSPLSDNEAAQLTMPVYVAIASDNSLAGGEGAVARADSALPDGTVQTWPNTTHSLPMEVAAPLGKRLQSFWAASEPGR